MNNNIWINRLAILVLMFMLYAAGYSGGKDQLLQAHHAHPECMKR